MKSRMLAVAALVTLSMHPAWGGGGAVAERRGKPSIINHDWPRASRSQSFTKREIVKWVVNEYRNAGQAAAFIEIVQRESSFDSTATNPTSGAYGLAQANPPSKYESVSDDWRTNPITQLRWMQKYIEDRYGDPKQALKHHNEYGWY